MNKEQYIKARETINVKRKELLETESKLKALYIEKNKPCNLKDTVKLVSNGGKTYIGEVMGFGLFAEEVFITALKVDGKAAYLSKPFRSIEVISVADNL